MLGHDIRCFIRQITRGPSGPEIVQLDQADHDMLQYAMVAILAIRSDCL